MHGSDGFLFEDGNEDASSLSDMYELLSKSPSSAKRIFPFLGGQEILDHPEHLHSRYIIDFFGVPQNELSDWPDLVQLVKTKVLAQRAGGRLESLPWWQHERSRPGLRAAIQELQHTFVHPFTSSNFAFARIPAVTLVATPHCVFASESYCFFCLVQSRVHETWVRCFASSLEDRLRYTPSDCFETFPFPLEFELNGVLDQSGRVYYQFREQLMVTNEEGLTKTYNRFHDPNERSSAIRTLRELHNAMDRAVLDAYGWKDLKPSCEFLLDYEEREDEDDSSYSHRKKPWRYRWPDDFRDEVLARLLELNKERAEDERLAGLAAENAGNGKGCKKRASVSVKKSTPKSGAQRPKLPGI